MGRSGVTGAAFCLANSVKGGPNVPHGGKRPGAGRKPYSVEVYRRRMEEVLLGRVSEDEWIAIVAAAIRQATEGDAAARQWLSDRVMGKVRDAPPATDPLAGVTEVVFRRLDRGGDGLP